MSPTTTTTATTTSLSVLLAVSIFMWMTTTCITRSSPVPDAAPIPAPDPEVSEEAVNMNVSNLGEALFLISGVFISAVQPEPSPKVALQLIMPDTPSRMALGNFTLLFRHENRSRTPWSVEAASVMTWVTNRVPGPGDVLRALCNDTFGRNVVTVLHVNNPKVSRSFTNASSYLTRLLESVGLPVISWDADFSTARQMERSLQLAPTLFHQTEAMLAFLRRFSWKFFSMVTTRVVGHEDFLASLKAQERQSRRRSLPDKYGHVGFEFKIQSSVVLKSVSDAEKMKEQLFSEIDPDTRIFLLHASPKEAKDILDVVQAMGWASKGYVWILTATALGDRADGDSANSYPLGTFAVTYESQVSDMREVVTRGIKVWLQALVDMDRDGQFQKDWQWDTKLACQQAHLNKWPGGQLLFEYLRNVSLPGNSRDEMPTEFNETGMVKLNKLSILNVMREVDESSMGNRFSSFSSTSSSSSGSYTQHGWGHGRRRRSPQHAPNASDVLPPPDAPRERGTHLRRRRHRHRRGRGFRDKRSLSKDQWNPGTKLDYGGSGSDDDDDDDSDDDVFHAGSASSWERRRDSGSLDVSEEGEMVSGGGVQGGFSGSFLEPKSGSVKTESDIRYGSQTAVSDKRQSSVLNHLYPGWGTTSNDAVPSSGSSSSGHVVGSRHREGSWNEKSSYSRMDTVAKRKTVQRSFGEYNGDSVDLSSGPDRTHNILSGSAAVYGETPIMAAARESQDRSHRRRWRREREAVRTLLRSKRQIQGLSYKQRFQTVATWDGRELSVMQIAWPGNSSHPPTGLPESYHLEVATYVEEPHVTYKPLDGQGTCDMHATRCHVYPRDEQDKRIAGLPKMAMCCSGLSIDILARISRELNFNYSLFEVESGGYGSAVDHTNNTEWTGLMGAVMKGQAEVAMAALSITPERQMAVDFSVPFLETGITIVVAIREGAISPTAFLEPYDYRSWTLILVFSVHATGASIFIFEWLSPYGLDQGHTPLSVHKFSLFRSFWLIWAMLFGAAVTTDVPRGVASRFLANIWALFALVFLASYTANLAAFMITKEEFYDLSGIQDWRLKNPHHRHPPFKYATMPNGSTESNIRKNHKDLYDHMKKYPQYTVKEAVNSLKNQKIQAFIYDATTLEYAVGRDVDCKLKSVGKRYAETGYGVGFPKNSRWTKKFNEVLLRMQDEGEIERLQKFWLAGACHKKSQHRGSSSHTLGILNFTSAFILLGGGVMLGVLLLMLEHAYFRFVRKSLKRWDRCGCCSLVSLSMGRSLTFEQSVMEAIDFQKLHKCRDPLCETQLWKARHELDIAMLKIDQLQRQLAKQEAREGNAIRETRAESPADDQGDATRQKDGILRKRVFQASPRPVARRTRAPSLPSPAASSAELYAGSTTPTCMSARERNMVSHPARSRGDKSDLSPSRTFGRRTRVSDGKIYENVDRGIDIESTI
ncbi:uncharacterized protein LOC143281574 [Babylonia areolata]|uniref:uncharacterized protein LOC143281574 n=1 Tax=Babylonia areolata TaxID=304850 RepID=UPI003FD65B58